MQRGRVVNALNQPPLIVLAHQKIFAASQAIRHTTRPEHVLAFKPADSV